MKKSGFNVPATILQASQARVAKLKQQMPEDRVKNSVVPELETNTPPKSEPVPIPNPKQNEQQSRSRSNSNTSKAVLEVEQIRIQREERRQKLAELRKQREEMSDFEQQTLYYRTTIDQFRLKFAKQRAKLKIKTSTNPAQLPQPKIKVLIRKRPLSDQGTGNLIRILKT
jgi:ribosomal protein L3